MKRHHIAIIDFGGDAISGLELLHDLGIVDLVIHNHGRHPAFYVLAVNLYRTGFGINALNLAVEHILFDLRLCKRGGETHQHEQAFSREIPWDSTHQLAASNEEIRIWKLESVRTITRWW